MVAASTIFGKIMSRSFYDRMMEIRMFDGVIGLIHSWELEFDDDDLIMTLDNRSETLTICG